MSGRFRHIRPTDWGNAVVARLPNGRDAGINIPAYLPPIAATVRNGLFQEPVLPITDNSESIQPRVSVGGSKSGMGYIALAVGWLIPGAGHLIMGQRKRGVIFLVAIHTLFFMGLLVGGVRALDRPRQRLWTYSQYMAGWPMLAGAQIRGRVYPADAPHPVGFSPLLQEVATAYCGLAGMLNLLVLTDLFMVVTQEPPL